MPLDCEESVGHSCGCPFGLSSETGLLSTISFSGSDRMDNVLKDHRWPALSVSDYTSLLTLTCGCTALVAIFWRQGGRSIPVDSRVPRLGKFLLSFVTDVTCALALAVSVPVSEECEDEAVLCSQSASSVRAGKAL